MEEVSHIMLNLCLYQHHELVQSALTLLMVQYNARRSLLLGLRQLQLLTTDRQEANFNKLESQLGQTYAT